MTIEVLRQLLRQAVLHNMIPERDYFLELMRTRYFVPALATAVERREKAAVLQAFHFLRPDFSIWGEMCERATSIGIAMDEINAVAGKYYDRRPLSRHSSGGGWCGHYS